MSFSHKDNIKIELPCWYHLLFRKLAEKAGQRAKWDNSREWSHKVPFHSLVRPFVCLSPSQDFLVHGGGDPM